MDTLDLDKLSDKVLDKIRRRPGQYYDIKYLAKCFKASEEGIHKSLEQLKKIGYTFKTDKSGRWALISPPDLLLPAEILFGLKTKIMAKNVFAFKMVQSTNTVASQLAVNGIAEGTLIAAEYQFGGRGRRGRVWQSPEKMGIYMSLVLRPSIHPNRAPGISLITAVVLAETILEYEDIDVKIKWPNDVLISGKKTAGILTELSGEPDRTDYVIVGVGINVNQRPADFPEDLRGTATSVRIGLKEKISRTDFMRRFLTRFERDYLVFKKKGLKAFHKKILQYSYLINREIQLKSGRKRVNGVVKDIDEEGRLVLETKDGLQEFYAGEATLHR